MSEKLTLTDLISVETLQRIQNAFSAMTGMAAMTTDAEGIPVTEASNFSDFCMKYMRGSEDGHIRCELCDRFGAEESRRKGCSSSYYCHAGMIDYAAPIIADKQMVGIIIGGQVLTQPPEQGHIYELAWELGIDAQALWEAAQKIHVLEEKTIDDAAQFLFTVANVLSDMAYGNYRMMQANKEIERANNMKSDFLANMSHEIRTPMNAVVGMAEMALRENPPPKVRDYIRQIKISSRALLTIINDILDFSKIESGKMDIVPVEYEAMSIVNDIANIVVERLKDKSVELILDISPDIPYILYGDNIRIKQILLNLANNAAKFTHEGQVIVRMSYTVSSEDEVILHFAVEDTGIGIKQEDLNAIFDSFRQVDSKRNRNIEGTGLGLAISRNLTQLMGGTLHVKSQYGKGSTFSFELPQRVVDKKPSCQVQNPEEIYVMGLLSSEYRKQSLKTDLERFGVEYRELSGAGEIDLIPEKRNFLFVEKELFTEELEELVQGMPALTAVLLLPFQNEVDDYDIPNLLKLRKPLYSMNEANIFNREEMYGSEGDNMAVNINFTAPDAKVLVVDDNEVNLVVTEGLLEPLQMRVDTVTSGKEALERILVERYDIIFMDHMMPDMDGVETTHLIREKHPDYNDIPIIALTANAMSGTKEKFLQEGMNDFVSKPIEIMNLIKKVAKWLPKEKIRYSGEALALARKEGSEEIVIGDLDTARAIGLVGNAKLYQTVLNNYYHAIEQKADRLKELEEKEDWENYTIEVHSLKSTSRQIGAMELASLAEELEAAGNAKDGGKIHANNEKMLEKYREYKEVLAPYCEEEKGGGERGAATKEQLRKFFEQLRDAVDELDMDKMEQVGAEMKAYSYGGRQQLFEELMKAIENIDGDTCLMIMELWEKEF